MHKFPYKWNLSDGYPASGIEPHHKKVFTTFSCGGGSTMGYKLAGYDVIGANDIDSQMKRIYEANHHPKYYFLSDIRSLINKTDWPEDFYDLDVLDGSPPCSTFSMAGDREQTWGKEKHFREGQVKQVLDDLFFDFIKLAAKLKPKIVIAENVKGLLIGNAKGYVKEIYHKFIEAGYDMQIFLFNGASMGVPQRRERIFFIGSRKTLGKPKLILRFNELAIPYKEIADYSGEALNKFNMYLWKRRSNKDNGLMDTKIRIGVKPSDFNCRYLKQNEVAPTLGSATRLINFNHPSYISTKSILLMSTFPIDYNFMGLNPKYVCGMSVPPVMMARVADEVYNQWLSKLN